MKEERVDIISTILDYIKEKLFREYLIDIFNNLEDNNVLTSLLILSNEKNEIISDDIIRDLQKCLIKDIKYKQKAYEPKFDLNFVIPGFYNAFELISSLISTTVKDEYIQNEQKLRYFFQGDKDKAKQEFIDKESFLIESLYDNLQRNENVFNMLDTIKIPEKIFLEDYITFYLNKYYFTEYIKNNSCYISYGKANHRLIKLLLKLRFRENNPIIIENKEDHLKLLLIKICWLESNLMYIIDILEIYSELKNIFIKEENKLIEIIENYSNSNKINYITNEKRNPEVTTTVNECYYLILAYIIYSIVYPNVDLKEKRGFEITVYFDSIKGALKKIENLSDNLIIYLNEMYIIGEFLQIYETLNSNIKIKLNLDLLNSISEVLRINIELIQGKEDSDKLIENFHQLYELITRNLSFTDKNYYSLLKYIFFNEIKKIADVKYRAAIFEKLLKEKEVIMNSKDILQMLLKKLIPLKKKKEKYEFINSIDYLLGDEGRIVPMMENILKDNKEANNFVLTETLLYFFEKDSKIFIDRIMNEKCKKNEVMTLDNEEILNILQKSIKFLDDYNNPKKYKDKNKNVCKLFCIGFIKIFCFIFVNLIQNSNNKIKEIKKVIDIINGSKTASKIITLYIYKIIYNINNQDLYLFSVREIREKFRLDEYNSFKDINITSDCPELSIQFSLDKEYEEVYAIVEKYKYDKFQKVNIEEFESRKIDKFYFASSNLILSNLKIKEFYKSETYNNFYKNVCIPLFKTSSTIFKAIRLLYDPEKFSKIKDSKEFQINNETLKALLYSYRYCLNEFTSDSKDTIYSSLYGKESDIKKFYYPGNDIRNLPIYEIYTKILNHFNEKPKQACFICMCDEGYYFSTRDEEPNEKELNAKCPKCQKPIGTKKEGRRVISIKRDNYFRVLTKDEYNYKYENEFSDYSYITIEDFKDIYINKKYLEEKGITKIEENHLKKDNKKVRNLSQVSYRLLNFLLYSHIFFARLISDNSIYDRNYKPEDYPWGKLIAQIWELLKMELNNNGINNIESFMNFIFNDLFKGLNKAKITEYQALIKIEKDLNNMIMDKIEIFKKDDKKETDLIKIVDKNNDYFIYNLLIEKYTEFNSEDFPFYNLFFYSNYISRDYLLQLLSLKDENKFPMLLEELSSYNQKENGISLKKLNLFNSVLNLFNEKYSYLITRIDANILSLKEEEIYKDNKEKIDKFIKFYNNIKKNQEIKELNENSKISEFFIDDKSAIGKSYIEIYKKFIEIQNNKLEKLLNIKINDEIFDENCKSKVNIQNVHENEIYSLNLPDKFSFNDIIFNYSYRKTLIDKDYKSYNIFVIDYDKIEGIMTDLLLKNKKLLNDNLIKFIYKNEDLKFDNNDIITKFNQYQEIDIDDKLIIYQFYEKNSEKLSLFLDIINDFMQLIIFVNKNRENNKIKDKLLGKNPIYEAIKLIGDNAVISEDFKNIFKFEEKNKEEEDEKEQKKIKDRKNLTINKITTLFIFYLRLIFEKILKDDFKEYQIHLGKELMENIEKYFIKENDYIIKKNTFKTAIIIFISVYLYKEKDKENKIKKNNNNIVNYFNIKDIWFDIPMNKPEFRKELKSIKNLNIQINQILNVYKFLYDENDKNVIEEVEEEIKTRKKDEEKIEESIKNDEINENEENDDENIIKPTIIEQNKNNNEPSEEEEEEDEELAKPDDDDRD